jgi:hypothetical protein
MIWMFLRKSTGQKPYFIIFVNHLMIWKRRWRRIRTKQYNFGVCSSFWGMLFTILKMLVLSIFTYTTLTYESMLGTHLWEDVWCTKAEIGKLFSWSFHPEVRYKKKGNNIGLKIICIKWHRSIKHIK